MFTIAYLANCFPVAVEPYVSAEIQELRRRGMCVVAGSVRRAKAGQDQPGMPADICLQPVRARTIVQAVVLLWQRRKNVRDLLVRILFRGKESLTVRCKALLHTTLGAYYAVLLQGRGVDHIHAHHGYFGSWIAMAAARLLGATFSLTLHGSDLLLHGVYLDAKLKDCMFCVTVSDYNRAYILQHFPEVDPEKVFIARLGVDTTEKRTSRHDEGNRRFTILAVGRLHAVKDHAFLIRACARLRDYGLKFECLIAGDGPERNRLEAQIRECGLQENVLLLGHVEREDMDALYERADMCVLTSRSEGIPLVLMEAMARRRIVLAPAITGIPEIVVSGKTGFLYAPGDMEDLVAKMIFLSLLVRSEDADARRRLEWVRHAAHAQIVQNFDRTKNLRHFAAEFEQRLAIGPDHLRSTPDEDPVLQQI